MAVDVACRPNVVFCRPKEVRVIIAAGRSSPHLYVSPDSVGFARVVGFIAGACGGEEYRVSGSVQPAIEVPSAVIRSFGVDVFGFTFLTGCTV